MESMLANEDMQVGEVAAALHVDFNHLMVAFGYVLCRELDLGFAKAGIWYS